MKIVKMSKLNGEGYRLTLENDETWEITCFSSVDENPYELRLNVSVADDSDEIREQGKLMITFANVVDALMELLPTLVLESVDDDHEMMFWIDMSEEDLNFIGSNV